MTIDNHFMHRGDAINNLLSMVDRADKRPVKQGFKTPADPLRWYIMQDSLGCTSGAPFEIHESQAARENDFMARATSDYRWVVIPERGWR